MKPTPQGDAPDGTLADVTTPFHRIRIVKHGSQVHFYFVNADGSLDGPMSRIDLRRPLHLIAEYTQAIMLALLWQPQPRHVCLLGLAGGRLSLVLQHHFPNLVIDNVELDPAVGPLAEQFFGLQFDGQQRLIVADAASFLATSTQQYAIIVMDAFRDATDELDHLATAAFYATCKQRLVSGGVLAANMLSSDPHFRQKQATFTAAFRFTMRYQHKHGVVLFGNDHTRLNASAMVKRAEALHNQHHFDFPLVARTKKLGE